MIMKPFPHLEMKNFLKGDEADNLLKKLKKQPFHPKRSVFTDRRTAKK